MPSVRGARGRTPALFSFFCFAFICLETHNLSDCRLFSRELEDLKKTLDVTGRFSMLDMRWKALERAVNLSQVSAQGDAIFLAFSRREEPYIIAQNTS